MSNYYTEHFKRFEPELLTVTGFISALRNQVYKQNILICGESHGVRENADIAYTLCRTLGIKHLAIERSETNFKKFIESAMHGTPNFMIPQALQSVQSSVLSIEMLKTIVVLLKSGAIEKISYVDIEYSKSLENLDTDEYMKVREEEIANNILSLSMPDPKLVILGNFHTRLEPDTEISFSSALQLVRKKMPEMPCLNYDYLSGSQYNSGRMLHFKNKLSRKDIKEEIEANFHIEMKSKIDFALRVPEAHPITT